MTFHKLDRTNQIFKCKIQTLTKTYLFIYCVTVLEQKTNININSYMYLMLFNRLIRLSVLVNKTSPGKLGQYHSLQVCHSLVPGNQSSLINDNFRKNNN